MPSARTACRLDIVTRAVEHDLCDYDRIYGSLEISVFAAPSCFAKAQRNASGWPTGFEPAKPPFSWLS